ncbi:OB-fold domain-containing protein [Mycobacterium sp. CVI_P3]|uniref:OB-fold domain-containing protein n=1 Tax=Mycobacterium pinniadriaticum TaxID=2994102 RepID=A0ABT3SH16_9MYCO|nr:OB-fold domain-containing protein [Mycobacterium pinniadriaticum]MCX2931758.1 OB-fold domain-containing protein [Mycobacterium pinniadriaticum]MCX2938167.1 OB-fold domain-containing protein [Mycobacterium pinniadriaticum]
MTEELAMRIVPEITELNRHFWTGGAEGALRFLRCTECGIYLHPPTPVCRKCLSENVEVATVSGRGRVVTFTINHQQWRPGVEVPYNIAVVELAEQQGLRLTTNIVSCPLERIEIGMQVAVEFEPAGSPSEPVFVPVFAPAGGPL